jgi:hypothetical protein
MSIIKELQPAPYLLIAKTNRTPIMDRPRPKSEGGFEKRFEAKGARYKAYKIEPYEGVQYALLETTNPQDEWTRVTEAGPEPFEWWSVTELEPPQDVVQARAMTRIADAATKFASAVENAVELLDNYLKFKMK